MPTVLCLFRTKPSQTKKEQMRSLAPQGPRDPRQAADLLCRCAMPRNQSSRISCSIFDERITAEMSKPRLKKTPTNQTQEETKTPDGRKKTPHPLGALFVLLRLTLIPEPFSSLRASWKIRREKMTGFPKNQALASFWFPTPLKTPAPLTGVFLLVSKHPPPKKKQRKGQKREKATNTQTPEATNPPQARKKAGRRGAQREGHGQGRGHLVLQQADHRGAEPGGALGGREVPHEEAEVASGFVWGAWGRTPPDQ